MLTAVFTEVVDFDGDEQGEEGVGDEFIVEEGCGHGELGGSGEVEEAGDGWVADEGSDEGFGAD